MAALLDTNFLLALAFPRDVNREIARSAMRDLTGERIIVAPVLSELFYLLTDRMYYFRAVQYLQHVHKGAFRIESLSATDRDRMESIMLEYTDNEFDYTDAAIMAVAERLNIETIYTFDHRDFSVFRPRHCDFLTLLP